MDLKIKLLTAALPFVRRGYDTSDLAESAALANRAADALLLVAEPDDHLRNHCARECMAAMLRDRVREVGSPAGVGENDLTELAALAYLAAAALMGPAASEVARQEAEAARLLQPVENDPMPVAEPEGDRSQALLAVFMAEAQAHERKVSEGFEAERAAIAEKAAPKPAIAEKAKAR